MIELLEYFKTNWAYGIILYVAALILVAVFGESSKGRKGRDE